MPKRSIVKGSKSVCLYGLSCVASTENECGSRAARRYGTRFVRDRAKRVQIPIAINRQKGKGEAHQSIVAVETRSDARSQPRVSGAPALGSDRSNSGLLLSQIVVASLFINKLSPDYQIALKLQYVTRVFKADSRVKKCARLSLFHRGYMLTSKTFRLASFVSVNTKFRLRYT